MGVYAKGMEMPKTCHGCELMECTLDLKMTVKEILCSRHPNCPLVEIPEPHGRLIDADVYKSQFQYWGKYDDECLDETPTVIEAEGE